MNTQVQTRQTSPAASFNAFMQKHKAQLELALPKHLNADRMVRLSLTAFSQNKALQQCDSKTIFASIIVASQLGLEPGVNGQGYLVPYKGVCTFIPGWKGLVDLANRGGRCTVWTGAVYEGDEFDYMLGDAPYCKHKPCGEFEESKLTHVYAIGRVKDSEMPVIEVWPVKKVYAHFKKNVVPALQSNHYSKKHFEAYAKKVALLQVLKYMPQSIEMSNAMDVSYAAEQGKNITIDGDFVTVEDNQHVENDAPHIEAYQQPQQIDQPAVYAQQPQQQHHEQQPQEQVQEESLKPTFAMIKHSILTVKSPAHLDFCEEQALDHDNSEERKQLMQLVRAQREKFNPTQAVATQVVEAKKPEPQPETEQQPEQPIEKKPTSRELRRTYAKALNTATTRADVIKVAKEIDVDNRITDADRKYLIDNIQQVEAEFTPAEETTAFQFNETALEVTKFKEQIEAAQTPEALTKIRATFAANGTFSDDQHAELNTALNQKMATLTKPKTVDVAKSQAIATNLTKMISDAATVEVLETTIAPSINAQSSQMTVEHLNQVKSTYAERKTFLENQISMFDDSYYEIAVEKIQSATSEQDVFDVTMSPDFAELDQEEKRMLNSMANQKLNELQQG
ncbi:recombinase RecT [uncultured Acinetobacter sp.]|uniref:recombinase RecT n=1 Tax=uncultured Acinetobacter sp. TaxID=165433 RepID=UPI0026097388|nr:recombinase RecT [uncultured Acinetobacter sp.]